MGGKELIIVDNKNYTIKLTECQNCDTHNLKYLLLSKQQEKVLINNPNVIMTIYTTSLGNTIELESILGFGELNTVTDDDLSNIIPINENIQVNGIYYKVYNKLSDGTNTYWWSQYFTRKGKLRSIMYQNKIEMIYGIFTITKK